MIEDIYKVHNKQIDERCISDVCVRYSLFSDLFSVPFLPADDPKFTFIDLFAGIGTFFKIGACPCLLKRKNDVEIIQVETIPVNLLLHTEKIPIYRKKMESEDILVMLSDGAFDGFSQNGLEMAARYLKEMDVVRPQAIAEGLYEQITTNKEKKKRDDMTIMVLGIWDRY